MGEHTFYHDGMLALQEAAGGRPLAAMLRDRVRHDTFSDEDRAFIGQAGFFLVATSFRDRPDCSFKAGEPGFVRVTGASTLEFPDYDGNLMFRTLGNISVNPNIAMLFIRFGPEPKRLRIHGRASLIVDPTRIATHYGARALVEVACSDLYPNCPRYIPDLGSDQPSAYVPRAGHTPPIPEWKRYPFVTPLLPATDPHKADVLASTAELP